jgi:hypothetical protein
MTRRQLKWWRTATTRRGPLTRNEVCDDGVDFLSWINTNLTWWSSFVVAGN